jgi:hypothetical protein
MMQQLMNMAKNLGASTAPESQQESVPPPMPNIDLGMLQKLSGITQQSAIDKNQQSLLHALSPYLSGDRIGRLEKAMRAAKMAKFASAFLGQGMF